MQIRVFPGDIRIRPRDNPRDVLFVAPRDEGDIGPSGELHVALELHAAIHPRRSREGLRNLP
jgi:hypothetical protein